MLPVDIDYCDQKSAEFCFGRTRYDPNIDMNSRAAQLAFKVNKNLKSKCNISAKIE